jgi:hypothetical protein
MLSKLFSLSLLSILWVSNINAQKLTSRLNDVVLNNLEGFESPSENWEIVGDIQGKYDSESLNSSKGTGILYNNFKKEQAVKF